MGEPQFHRPLLQHESSRPGVEAGPSTNSMVWGVGGSTLQTVAEVLGGGEQSTGCPRLPLQPACRANLSMRGGGYCWESSTPPFQRETLPLHQVAGTGPHRGLPWELESSKANSRLGPQGSPLPATTLPPASSPAA